MKVIFFITTLIFILLACGGGKKEDSVHTKIVQYEDSIAQWGGGQGDIDRRNDFANRYISVLQQAYNEEPENPKTPGYLDRIHMWYSTIGDANNSMKWAKILLEKYPKYENREMLLESIASMYDSEIIPRDSLKVKEYYTQLLKEFPNLDKEKRNDIENRLKYNNLTFEAYLMKQINDIELP